MPLALYLAGVGEVIAHVATVFVFQPSKAPSM